jgi:hypothetical protein
LVERFNSYHSSLQHKRNKSKRSQNDESRQERKGKVEEHEEQNVNHKKLITNRILKDTRWQGPPFPLQNLEFLHKSLNLWTSLTRTLKGGETRKQERKNERGEGDGAPSSYLTGLIHNPSFAPRYFKSNHLTRGRYGPT